MTDEAPSLDAFETVAHEARLSILRALLAERRTSEDPHLGFTDLRDRAGIEDTGRFNYHLGRLRGTFVRKADEGYRLTTFAHRLLAPMVGGVYDPEWAPEPVDSPGECSECGRELVIRPEGATLQLVCEDEHVINSGLLGYPAAMTGRSAGETVTALGLLNLHGIEQAVAGVCPLCHGRVDGSVSEHGGVGGYLFEAPCGTCGNQFAAPVGYCVATHPTVAGFLADHGVDVRRTAPWALDFCTAGAERVTSEDPLRLELRIERGDDTLSVLVDRDGSVVSAERRGG